MGSLEYSKEALEVKGFFYDKEITVYVEGKDDPLFWQSIFELAEVKAYIEEVGGRNELEKYYDYIVNEDATFIIATDNDNTEFMKDSITHRNIIRSYGYSIENSMYYYRKPIEKTISNLCRKKLDISVEFDNWIGDFVSNVRELIVYDIANNRFKRGISVFGDNCYRFLKSQKSHEICSIKTSQFLNSIKNKFTDDEINEVNLMVTHSDKELWFLIKGHFITHALINLIKHTVKKNTGNSPSMTTDFLYSITIDTTSDWESRVDIRTLVEQVQILT